MLPVPLATDTHTPSSPSFYSQSVLEGKDAQDPRKVASLFEALFYRMLLQQMRESPFEEDDMFGGSSMDTVKEMRDNELANHLGMMHQLGIADLVMEEMNEQQEGGLGLLKS